MGDCSSTQETLQPNKEMQVQSAEAHFVQFDAHKDHNCNAGNIYNIYVPDQPPQLTDFSALILKDVLTQHIQLDKDEKQAIFKNIEKLDFRVTNCFGAIQIINKQTCVPLFSSNNVTMMGCGNFGQGRVVGFAHEAIFKEFCVINKDWIILMRNIIRWITKNKADTPQKPIKILMTTPSPNSELVPALGRAMVNVEINYECQFSEVDLSQYDCLFIYEFSQKKMTEADSQKVVDFVKRGGGLLIALRGWVFKNYGEGKQQTDWVNQCLYNKIISPMGMKFTENWTKFDELTLKPKQIIQLAPKTLKPYTKQLNPLFVEDYQSEEKGLLQEDKAYILQGVGDCTFGNGMAVSSFSFSEKSCISIFSTQQKDFCVAGRYGEGKVFIFGHTEIYEKKFIEQSSQKALVQNVVKWMCGQKQTVNIGLLHQSGYWCKNWNNPLSLQSIDINTSVYFVDQQQDLEGLDIACVTYYSDYPDTMTPSFNEKVRAFVENGGNLFFVSHGWVWQNYGEYKKNSSLQYEKNFANYVLLKQFDINLNKDCFSVPNPLRPTINTGTKDIALQTFLKNDLLAVLKNNSKSSFSSTQSVVQAYLSKIGCTDPSQFELICSIQLYHQLVQAFISSRFNIDKNYDTLSFADPFICNVFNLMNAISYACPPHICRALPPSLNTYPGYATKRLDSKTVQVYKNRNKLVFPGLYINPGEVIKVKHNNDYKDISGVQLKINFNLDLTKKDNGKLKRFVNIGRTIKIKSKEFLVASPHGGILYFEVQNKSTDAKPLSFTFQGAYESIYWNENFNSYADFEKIKKIDSPFFIIQTKRIILMGRTQKILGHLNIKLEKLCKFWNTVVGHFKDYRGIEQYPFEKQAYFNDANLMLGYMHSGTPVMTHEDLTFEMLGVGDKLFTDATWGFYHEFGHNHQDSKWTLGQMTEVTCNIYSLVLINKMHGVTIAQNMWVERKMEDTVRKYFNKPNRTLKDYGQDPFLALVLFACLMEEFGYDIFSQVHKRYNNLTLPSYTNEAKVDMLVEQVSAVIGQNVWYYFKSWGLPVTNNSLSKVSKLKKYQCQRFPYITQG